VTIDFAQPARPRLVADLVRDADVVLENFRVGTLARHGLDYATLAPINPAPRLLLDHRLRADRPVPRASRLRRDLPVDGRA
jgi:hypothetical protein